MRGLQETILATLTVAGVWLVLSMVTVAVWASCAALVRRSGRQS